MQVLQQQAQAAATVPMYQPPAAPVQHPPSAAPVQHQPPTAPVQQATDLDVTELENLLCKIMESCTKESISVSRRQRFR